MTVEAPRTGTSRIFLVEDHPFMRKSMVAALEREPGLSVCGEAEDAVEAFAAIRIATPDLVITDLTLKSSNGIELIRILRAYAPALPVIATTMFDVKANERLARAAGAIRFVSKHDGPDSLIAAVNQVLKSRAGDGHAPGADNQSPQSP